MKDNDKSSNFQWSFNMGNQPTEYELEMSLEKCADSIKITVSSLEEIGVNYNTSIDLDFIEKRKLNAIFPNIATFFNLLKSFIQQKKALFELKDGTVFIYINYEIKSEKMNIPINISIDLKKSKIHVDNKYLIGDLKTQKFTNMAQNKKLKT